MARHGFFTAANTAFNVSAVSLVFVAELESDADQSGNNDFRGMVGSLSITPGYVLILEQDSRGVSFSVVSGGTRYTLETGIVPDIGATHHWVATWVSGLAKVYLDGQLVAEEQTAGTTIDSLDTGFEIVGVSHFDAEPAFHHWPGVVSEAAILDFALTATQVEDLHTASGLPSVLPIAHHDASPTFGTLVVAAASIDLTHFDASPTFGTLEVAVGTGIVTLTHLDASASFGTMVVGATTLDLTHLDASPTFGTPVVAGADVVHLTHFDASPTFGTLVVGATSITLTGLDASPSFGGVTVAAFLDPTHLDASPTFGTIEVVSTKEYVDLTHLDAAASFGVLVVGATTLTLTHFDASPSFGTIRVNPPQLVSVGPTTVTVDASTTHIVLNGSLTSTDLDESSTLVSVDRSQTTA